MGQSPGHKEGQNEETEDGGIAVETEEQRPDLDHPKKYAVILHNDDYTSMDFVIEVLRRFFHKTKEESEAIMWKVHREGRGVAGIYSFEIAETKVAQVTEAARARGFPLKCTLEEIT